MAVVVNQAQFSELVHKKTYAGARCTEQLRNGLAPISIEKPFVALFEAGTDPEIPI